MRRTILVLRICFVLASLIAGGLIAYLNSDHQAWVAILVAFLLSVFVILIDVLLKGFSIRGLTAASLGLAMGALISFLVGTSPFFEPLESDPDLGPNVYLVRLILFCALSYICAVIALRGKDELNMIIPYVRFSKQEHRANLAVVDTSALIDGRLARICESGWMGFALVVPQFVIDELHGIAESKDSSKRAKGQHGIETLNLIRQMDQVDLQVPDSDIEKGTDVEAKVLFLAESMNACLLTIDINLAKLAELRGIPWLNVQDLARALQKEVIVGDRFEIDLVKQGRESDQAVGFISDGSMVVVGQASQHIGSRVSCEVESILPTTGGRMIFAKFLADPVSV